jgi:glycyl-tRNA synthetase beta chain
MPDLLIELFSEDIPARMQSRARDDLKRLVTDGLVEAGLTYAGAAAFSTPRRLTLAVEGLAAASMPVRDERKGPRTDAPAAAVEGFLRSTGLAREALEAREVGKATFLFAVLTKPGRPAAEIVAEVLARVIRAFPWPKSMRWGAGSLRWVRPLRRILCVLSSEAGAEVVPLEVEGIVAGNLTEGHRFMAPGAFPVTSFAHYSARLTRAFVVLDHAGREAAIWHDLGAQAFARGLEPVPDPGLLAEVAGLVEWPVVLLGGIEARFLHLPPEVLQTSMREHQKFFSLRNPRTGRIEAFATVANRETADHGATILKGNLKVLAARLSDAAFFFENDLREARAGMGAWAEGLKAVTFHARLGTQAERVERIAALAREIAPAVGAEPDLAERAAKIAKLDLRSAMVGEFPELQGVMGRYYALEALSADPARIPGRGPGEPGGPGSGPGRVEALADAVRDHYAPLGPADAVPSAPVSVAVALADKLDTLTGFWAIGEKPTGSKDPFALRRAALGVIRLVVGANARNAFSNLLEETYLALLKERSNADALLMVWRSGDDGILMQSRVDVTQEGLDQGVYYLIPRGTSIGPLAGFKKLTSQFSPVPRAIAEDLLSFLHDRLKVFLRDRGIRHDVIDACLAMPGNDDLTLLVRRAEALAAVLETEDGANLVQGFRRANNILTQAEAKDGVEYSFGADVKFAEGPEERALFAALDRAEAEIAPAMAREDFAAAMAAMAGLRPAVDAFFEAVQVNSDNPVIRRNRLNLLHRIRAACLAVADLTKLEG